MKRYTTEEWNKAGKELFGHKRDWKFVCPRCGVIQSPKDFLFIDTNENFLESIVLNTNRKCIGNFLGSGPFRGNNSKGCNFDIEKSVFPIHTVEIVDGENKTPVFDFAPKDAVSIFENEHSRGEEKDFYNTTNIDGEELKTAHKQAVFAQDKIKLFFYHNKESSFTPWEVLDKLFGESRTPITSVRRAITNLTDAGFLIRTDEKVIERYGARNYKWKWLEISE